MPKGIPDTVSQQLAAADARQGFPAGTMASIMQQEVGGQFDKFLGDPTAYHYEPDQAGKRKSSAFGPFGILESTGASPGYGVAPLKDKSLAEQVRFAADYLGARSKAAGGLKQGLAGYGEGDGYADQVLARTGGSGAGGAAAPVLASAAPEGRAAPPVVEAPPVVAAAAPDAAQLGAWQNFLQGMAPVQRPVSVASLDYGPASSIAAPNFSAPPAARTLAPNFAAFSSYGRRRA